MSISQPDIFEEDVGSTEFLCLSRPDIQVDLFHDVSIKIDDNAFSELYKPRVSV